jgi:hypothetical protein
MADLDLAAIRARSEAGKWNRVSRIRSAEDVPALCDEIDRLRAVLRDIASTKGAITCGHSLMAEVALNGAR